MEEQKFSIEPYLVRLDEALAANKKWLVALALGAFVLKIVYVLESADSLQLRVPIMDAKYYDNTARDILAGNVLRREAFFMGPLYSYFLAVVYGVFGRDFTVVRLIQAAGGTATIVLTYLLGCRAFRPAIGLLSAILLALYGAFAFYETQILMMWMGTLLNTAMLLLLLRIKPQSRPFSYLAPGFLLGLSALARANILVFWPIAIVWILVVHQATSRWAKAAAFTAATVIAILPVTIHNYIASRDFVPVTSNAGINFYIGNSEVATGIFYPPPGTDFVTDATTRSYVERLTGRDMTPSEVSAYWFDKAFSFIRSHPAAELKLLGRKAAMFFNAYEMPQIESYDLTRRRYSSLRLFPIHFWFLGAVGIFGLLFSLSQWRKHFLLYGFVLSYALSIVCFFVTARYRIQIAPVMALFTGYALLGPLPRVNNVRRGVGTLGLLLLIFFLTQPRLFAMDPDEVDFREHTHEARRASAVGEYERAVEKIDLAIELFPDYYEGYLHRAIIHKEGKQLFKAIEDYSRALQGSPDLSSVHYDLAQTFRRVNLRHQAIDEYRKALELDPVMIKAYNNLGITYSELGQYQLAVENFERVIEMDPSYLKAYNNLGAALAESGRVDQAIDVLRKAVERDPNYARSYRNLANAYISNRMIQPAIEALTAYVRLVPGDDKARADLDKLYIAARGDSSAASPENRDESGD